MIKNIAIMTIESTHSKTLSILNTSGIKPSSIGYSSVLPKSHIDYLLCVCHAFVY